MHLREREEERRVERCLPLSEDVAECRLDRIAPKVGTEEGPGQRGRTRRQIV